MSIVSSSITATKPKISNSFKLLIGPTVAEIQRKYEILSDIVIEYNEKVHSFYSYIYSKNNNSTMSLIVYYEVPKVQLVEAVKQKFDNFKKNVVLIANRNWGIEGEIFHTFPIMTTKLVKLSPSNSIFMILYEVI
jgi:hypothetical protein